LPKIARFTLDCRISEVQQKAYRLRFHSSDISTAAAATSSGVRNPAEIGAAAAAKGSGNTEISAAAGSGS
jgi:hypothetical protein